MLPEVTTVVTQKEVQFFGTFRECEGKVFIASIQLEESFNVIKAKLEVLMGGLAKLVNEDKPQYLIHDLLDKKGRLKDLKVRKVSSNRRRWDYVDARGNKQSRMLVTTTEHADHYYYHQKLLVRYGIPEESCTAIVIGAMIKNMIKGR